MKKRKFDVTGMTCSSCQLTVEKAVKKLGIEKANVSLLTNTLEIEDDKIEDKEIVQAIENAGYGAKSRDESSSKSKIKNPKEMLENEANGLKIRLIISLPLMLILMYVAMAEMINLPYPELLSGVEGAGLYAFIQFLIALPILYVNRSYFIHGFKALFKGHPNMDSLVALGSASAIIYGIFATLMILFGLGNENHELVHHYRHDLYYEAATMILTLITLGKYLEVRSKTKTTDSINKLIELQEDQVRLVKDGVEEMVALEDVKEGDLIKVIPGERISLDGKVISGNSSIDTSAVTGESMPVEIKEGDSVISGSINNNGSFIMQASAVGQDTTISKIIALMEEASASKAKISKLADKISGVFVPVVTALSIISFIVWTLAGADFSFAFSIAIGILVISCPCALGLATPVAMMVATGKAADNGILIKNAEVLEELHEVKTVIFDKTGTLTRGKAQLTDILTINSRNEDELLQIAYTLENNSQHPLAIAIISYVKEKNIPTREMEEFTSITARGVTGKIDGISYYLGNDKLMKDRGLYSEKIEEAANRLSHQGKTSVYLSDESNILAVFAIADAVKKSSYKAIEEIEKMGVKTVMLTGDNRLTAKAIADDIKISEFRAELLPQDKDKIVEEYKENGKVVMVGDGINDAPALMRADVGIAIAAGTDIAIESADMVLMKSNLLDIVNSIRMSKETIKTIKQNLFWAFFYNVISIPLAMGLFYPSFGIKLNPMIGALAMSLSSVFVVTNSLRLRSVKMQTESFDENYAIINDVKVDNLEIIDENINNKVMEVTNMTNKKLHIEGMSCSHCKMNVERILNKYGKNAEVSLEDKTAVFEANSDIDMDKLTEELTNSGYELKDVI